MSQNQHIAKAIEICNQSQTELARRMGGKTRQGHVYLWLNNQRSISAESAKLVEMATEGLVTRQDLRPDIFGDLTKIEDISDKHEISMSETGKSKN